MPSQWSGENIEKYRVAIWRNKEYTFFLVVHCLQEVRKDVDP